ncbi:MAG: arginase family protein [Lewinellaceae bacterium]|nr:arginase family protein [Lewinellaceae bacterium]
MDKPNKKGSLASNNSRSRNGQFLGMPYTREEARVILLFAPWTVSQPLGGSGHSGPANILESSYTLPLSGPDVPKAGKTGIYGRLPAEDILEKGKQLAENEAKIPAEELIRKADALNGWLNREASGLLENKKRVGLIGGDCSTQIGLLSALAGRYSEFGILHLGAGMGLGSISSDTGCTPDNLFSHALQLSSVSQLTLAGVRSYSAEEENLTAGREEISVFYNHEIRRRLYRGHTFGQICGDIIRGLPDQVYLSFDINALQPQYCPNAARRFPGGFDFEEALYLIKRLVDAELEIIGFGLCGVAGREHPWDGKVGALLAYRIAALMGSSSWL